VAKANVLDNSAGVVYRDFWSSCPDLQNALEVTELSAGVLESALSFTELSLKKTYLPVQVLQNALQVS
jgi:hypothetical protein